MSLDAGVHAETAAHAKARAGAPMSVGTNGSLQHNVDGMLGLFDKLVRGIEQTQLRALFSRAAQSALPGRSTPLDLALIAFHTRATRGAGKGERDLALRLLELLRETFGPGVCDLLELLPHYGCWADLVRLHRLTAYADVRERCVAVYASQIRQEAELGGDPATARNAPQGCVDGFQIVDASDAADVEPDGASGARASGQLTMAAKWAPTNERNRHSKSFQMALATALFPLAACPLAQYRKCIVRLRRQLVLPETLMCAGDWSSIDFTKHVPAVCLRRNRLAFLNEVRVDAERDGVVHADAERTGNRHPTNEDRVGCRANLRAALSKNTPGRRGIKGGSCFPHELAKPFLDPHSHWSMLPGGPTPPMSLAERQVLNEQWRDMVRDTRTRLAARAPERGTASAFCLDECVALCDVSGSMYAYGGAPSGLSRPIDAAVALSLLVSELAPDGFRDRVLTFSSTPTWHQLPAEATLEDRVDSLARAEWGMSTNFEAAFRLILSAARDAGLTRLPTLIVFSDMQFDQAEMDRDAHLTRYRQFVAECTADGIEPPRLVFWNLSGATAPRYGVSAAPVAADDRNAQLLSGFSPAMLNAMMASDLGACQAANVTPVSTMCAALDHGDFDTLRELIARKHVAPFAQSH